MLTSNVFPITKVFSLSLWNILDNIIVFELFQILSLEGLGDFRKNFCDWGFEPKHNFEYLNAKLQQFGKVILESSA